ncbi:hypothetical protein LCGC14_1595520, partial [marine sediment metagenome]
KTEEPIVIEEETVEMSENPQVLAWISKRRDNLLIKKVNTNFKTFLLQLITDVMNLDIIIVKSYKIYESLFIVCNYFFPFYL